MNTLHATIATASPALIVSSAVFAHGGRDGATLYHYLSSPDHVLAFGVLAMVALAACGRLSRTLAVIARRNKRPPC
jgi:hypothetical protein